MPHEAEVINGGESPLASRSQAGAERTGQLQAGLNGMDGGHAPEGLGGEQMPASSSDEATGLANNSGIMRA